MVSTMSVDRRRLNITPSDAVWAAVDEMHAITGKPKAGIAAEMLDAVAPVMLDQAKLLRQIQETPEQARELLMQFGTHGIQTISQQMLELPPVKKPRGRPRKNAAP